MLSENTAEGNMSFEDIPFGSYDKAENKANRAFELYENGKENEALGQIEEALQINPANCSWHFNKALVLDTKGQFDDAITEYEIALSLNPHDLEILNSLAVDYTRTGQYDLAINTFEKIQYLDHKFEPCYCNRIITYTEMGQHDLAEQMFYLAQQINPDCALCYYNIGNSLFARGQYKKAIHCWLKTAELEPGHPQINYRIAQACWSEGDRQRGREHFLAELRVNPGQIDVILDFGLFLLEAGDIESAKEKFNRILELKPDFAPALFYLGETAFNNALTAETAESAEEDRDKKQNKNHKFHRSQISKISAYSANSAVKFEQAVKLFNQALQEDDTLTGPRFRLAQYALMRGERQKARNYLVSEVKLAPEDADTWVSMGSMFLRIGDLDYATHCLMRAVDIDCANTDAYYYLGLVSAIRGRFEAAVDFFDQTLEYKGEQIGALRDSALVCLTMGRLHEAAKRAKKALALDRDNSQLKVLNRRVRLLQAAERIRDFLCRFKS